MALDYKEIEAECINVIKEQKAYFITDLFPSISFSHTTFYDRGLDKSEGIKKALATNRISVKKNLRTKWELSDNPTCQLALYKIVGTEEEAHRLNGSRQEVKHEGESSIVVTRTKKKK